jgi:hypothetical protein
MTGVPDPKFFDGMKAEHCSKAGSDLVFTTPNYKFVTTASQEWGIIVERNPCQPENMGHGRVIKDLEESCDLGRKQGNLVREEVIAIILYTGPMVIYSQVHLYPGFSSLTCDLVIACMVMYVVQQFVSAMIKVCVF